ncbi:hypothetical protein [Nostoc sp. CHAB 5715]|uniref:hypothetical protein n=1 Tax=Nostoc sp. CHAB 5715 TaxID=2780400 RepID=UPI001E51242F|nr:hypothetical protein [Nostoc sp. CHAB 5715]MCC5625872.1 hypothetical protein [Nostoc sp. CHAB 5715]
MKKLFAGLLVALLVGCSVQARTQQNPSTKASETIDYPKALALKDGKKQPTEIDVYKQQFQKLEKLCIENDGDLAGMIYTIAKKGKAAGYEWSTNIDTLNSFIQMAESGFERKPAHCMEVYLALNKDLQEESSESSK